MMERVLECIQNRENGLLESPTGTGKTLSLLVGALAWKKHELEVNRLNNPEVEIHNRQFADIAKPSGTRSLIIYASRTHSQLGQVIKELKQTGYHPNISLLGSRANLCVHPDVSLQKGNAQRTLCEQLVKAKRCKFKEGITTMATSWCSQGSMQGSTSIMDIEDLGRFGKENSVCPFYLGRNDEIQQRVDLVFMPYNYLVDPAVRRGLKMRWEDAVVIVDEAHNLADVCKEAASLSMKSVDIAKSLAELEQCLQLLGSANDAGLEDLLGGALDDRPSQDELLFLKKMLLDLEKTIDAIPFRHDPDINTGMSSTRPGDYFFEVLENAGVTEQTVGVVTNCIDRATSFSTKAYSLDAFGKSLARAFAGSERGENVRDRAREYFKVFVCEDADATRMLKLRKKNNSRSSNFFGAPSSSSSSVFGQQRLDEMGQKKTPRVLNLWCFSPGVTLQELLNLRVRSIILTSGTLAPLSSFASQMRIPFKVTLENPHVVDDSQVWLGVVTSGPTQKLLSSKYSNRNEEYRKELGNSIANFARNVPDGLLVFFPSYTEMHNCVNSWKDRTDIWRRVERHKKIFVEERKAADMKAVIDAYYQCIDQGVGGMFMAVCRGKASEGIDFSDKKARAVIITGLPLPPFKEPQIVLNRKFLDHQDKMIRRHGLDSSLLLSGQEWYNQRADRAVNQAVGRVIRHKHDFGAVILCDNRFAQKQQALSKWLRHRHHVLEKFGLAAKELTNFFKFHQNKRPIEAQAQAQAQRRFGDQPLDVKKTEVIQQSLSKASAKPKRYNPDEARLLKKFKPNCVPKPKKQESLTAVLSKVTRAPILTIGGANLGKSGSRLTKETRSANDNFASEWMRTSSPSQDPLLQESQQESQLERKRKEHRKANRTKDFISAAKQKLSKEEYKKFKASLQDLDKWKKANPERARSQTTKLNKAEVAMITPLGHIFKGSDRKALKLQFVSFLPLSHQRHFRDRFL